MYNTHLHIQHLVGKRVPNDFLTAGRDRKRRKSELENVGKKKREENSNVSIMEKGRFSGDLSLKR